MGDQYIKVDGAWVKAQRPYVKRGNVWYPVRETYVKQAGSWTSEWKYDSTPPAPPELTLQVIDTSGYRFVKGSPLPEWVSYRYIQVGARIPGVANDPSVKRIRVLASTSGYPSSPLGGGYISAKDNTYPNESWSDWYYNAPTANNTLGDHGTTADLDYKEYPVNAGSSTNLPGGKWYYFGSWSEDFDGNWSVGTWNRVWMPKTGVKAEDLIIKEANFQAVNAGSLNADGSAFTEGDLIARDSPRSNGIWYYGNRFTDSVGESGTPTVQSAKIRVTRGNDSGQATANVNLFWHGHISKTDLPVPLADMKDTTKIGTINKGETKWFDIPSSWWPKFNTQIKGFGLRYGTLASDFIQAKSLANDLRCGEVNLVWEEAT